MTVRFVRTNRIPRYPIWGVLVVGVWIALQILTLVLSAQTDRDVITCPLKRFTAVPCPTCGATRCVLCLAQGDLLGALLYNPLLFSVLSVLAIILLIRLVSGWSLRASLTPVERRLAWAAGTVLLLLNWAYLIRFVG